MMNINQGINQPLPNNPVLDAGIWSKLSFCWMYDMFRLGLQRPIVEQDVYECLPNLRVTPLSDNFENIWRVEQQKPLPSLYRTIRNTFAPKFMLLGGLCGLIDIVFLIIQPQCLGGLVVYFSSDGQHLTATDAKLYIAGIIIGLSVGAINFHFIAMYGKLIGTKVRQTCISMIYKKTLRLSKSGISVDGLNGQVINLITNDVSRFNIVFSFIDSLWKGPLVLVLICYFIYREIGYFAFIGVGMVLCSLPFQVWVGKQTARYRTRTVEQSGRRLRLMNELLQAIQVIKMYTWEQPFARKVDAIRKNELRSVRSALFISGLLKISDMFANLATFLCLSTYVYSGNVFTAQKVYILAAYMTSMYKWAVYFFMFAVQMYAEAVVSIGRIEKFLMLPETKDDMGKERRTKELNQTDLNDKAAVELDTLLPKDDMPLEQQSKVEKRMINPNAEKKGVIISNATASWCSVEPAGNGGVGIRKMDLTVPANTLCTLIGAVGSGKSSVLQVILGELELDEGQVQVNGSLSYASQEAWLFDGTIRQNIVFVEEFVEDRYNEVLYVCALQRDLELLPHGDLTIVGERGHNLSGGQRARINLARAIYRKADIYLLDDPLSAVDTRVGKHLFEKCIIQFLKDKVCVLVTHQMQYLKNVENIVMLNGGQIETHGSFGQLQKMDVPLFDMVESEAESEKSIGLQETQGTLKQSENKELQSIGTKGLFLYRPYFASVNSIAFVVTVFALFLIVQGTRTFTDVYLAKWAMWEDTIRTTRGQAENNNASTTTLTEFEQHVLSERFALNRVYTIGMIIVFLSALCRNFSFFQMCVMASRHLHDRMFCGITRARMGFFNANPSGWILNRFSKDIDCIDTVLPLCMFETITLGLMIVVSVYLASQWHIWMILSTVVLGLVLISLRHIYRRTCQPVNRIHVISHSPILAHTNASLQGLATIRAFNAERVLTRELDTFLDFNSSADYLFTAASRAFALWVELSGIFYLLLFFCFLVWTGNDEMSAEIGLIITQMLLVIDRVQWMIRQQTEVENQMINVHRVAEYADLPSEPQFESDPNNCPSKEWPSLGAIRFESLSMRYTDKGPFVLHDLEVDIGPSEKIGIVGRTGAGKSSIIQAIYRLAFNEGQIIVDGVDIGRLGLHDLRSRISIIPQDPILFSGTLRHNLDPFDQWSDEDIWKSLELADLKHTIAAMSAGLETRISDGGSNFSLGQRQLVCLARAILKKNRILILDEATANVDADTDRVIQSSIGQHFRECTVLTIAHRLNTIMNSDRVLVMDGGHAVEFDSPRVLLQNPNGHFSQLVRQTGAESAVELTRLANQVIQKEL